MYKYDEKSNVIINTETAEVIPVNEIFHGMALDMLDSFFRLYHSSFQACRPHGSCRFIYQSCGCL